MKIVGVGRAAQCGFTVDTMVALNAFPSTEDLRLGLYIKWCRDIVQFVHGVKHNVLKCVYIDCADLLDRLSKMYFLLCFIACFLGRILL